MGKPWKKRRADRGHHGPCQVPGCGGTGVATNHCVICENQRDAGKRAAEDVYAVAFCRGHTGIAEQMVRRHILTKHPQAIPAWMLAKLTGRA